jgi:hypothetical protein
MLTEAVDCTVPKIKHKSFSLILDPTKNKNKPTSLPVVQTAWSTNIMICVIE